MEYGKYCTSGLAVIDAKKFESMCVKISNVISNLDPKKSIPAVKEPSRGKTLQPTEGIQCRYTDDADDACKYYYQDKAGKDQLLANEICECSLREEITPGLKPVKGMELPYSYHKLPEKEQKGLPYYGLTRLRIEEG